MKSGLLSGPEMLKDDGARFSGIYSFAHNWEKLPKWPHNIHVTLEIFLT